MRVLLRKEWRESRALVIGFILLAPVLSVALKWGLIGWKNTAPADSIQFVAPGLLTLFVLAIAADLVSSDASSGRAGFFAALPVSPSAVWASKALFLFGAAALYLAYVLLVEVLVLSLAGKYWPHMFGEAAARWWPYMIAVATLGAATLFFSTLLDRGFAAAFAALVALGGVFLLLRAGRESYDVVALWPSLAIVLFLAFLAGSYLAFTRGRIHLGARIRRVALAATAFLLVAVPISARQVLAIEDWRRIDPADGDYELTHLATSPDGRWVLVIARRAVEGPLGARASSRRWAVDSVEGTVRDWTDAGRFIDEIRSFEEGPGKLVLSRTEHTPEEMIKVVHLRVVYDLAVGLPETVRAVDPHILWRPHRHRVGPLTMVYLPDQRVLRPGRQPVRVPEGWSSLHVASSWAMAVHGRWLSRDFGILDLDSGEVRLLDDRPLLLPPTRSGAAVVFRDGKVVRLPLEGGEVEVLIDAPMRDCRISLDGLHAAVVADDALWICRAADATAEKLPLPAIDEALIEAWWSSDGRSLLADTQGGVRLVELTADGVRVRETGLEEIAMSPALHFDGERVLTMEDTRLSAISLDGTVTRLLPREGD